MSKNLQPFSPIRHCPFCGEEGDLFKEPLDYFEPTEMYFMCLGCGAKGSSAFNPEEALAHWNRRYIITTRQAERDSKALEPIRETLDDLTTEQLCIHLSEVGRLVD